MNLYIYSDESGVFDKVHNDIYVYGGVLFLSKEDKDINARKYKHVEKVIRESEGYDKNIELKACILENKEKSKIYRSLNKCIKFGVIVNQKNIRDEIFANKKSKQRYLDYAYNKFYPPIFKNIKSVNVNYCNSNSVTLIRAADIVANNIYYKAIRSIENTSNNLYLTTLP